MMNDRHVWLCILTVAGCIGFLAGMNVHADEDQADGYAGMALAVVGDMPAEQVERLRSFAEVNTSIPVVLREVPSYEEDALAVMARSLTDVRQPEDAVLVLLYAGTQSFEEHALYLYEDFVAIVNTTALATEDEEKYMRRLERVMMRSFGLLMDVPVVPNPQSAMWAYRTLEELDFMGRNFDPPSLIAIQRNAVAKGIPLIVDSPFMVLEEFRPEFVPADQ
jgi:hypothetical protein